mgnify:CR=1 FL=1
MGIIIGPHGRQTTNGMNRSVEQLERLANQWILGDRGIEGGTLGSVGRLSRCGEFDGQRPAGGLTKNARDSIHVRLDESCGGGVGSPEPDSDPIGITRVELELAEESLIGTAA